MKRTLHYYEIAAKGGHDQARANLGVLNWNLDNTEVAIKHYMIAAAQGNDHALNGIKEGYMEGNVTKDDFAKALRDHKSAQDEMKSDQRAKAKQRRG